MLMIMIMTMMMMMMMMMMMIIIMSTKVNQVNVVFDFLAEYQQSLKNDLNEHLTGKNEEETQYLHVIMKSQKWIISQNVVIIKND